MKKFIALMLLITMFTPTLSFAEEGDAVKEVPKKYQKELGERYLLVDEIYLRMLMSRAEEADLLEVKVNLVIADLEKFKNYSTSLEIAVKESTQHISRLNLYIDDQERIIKSLQPTWFDKQKFFIGVLTGVAITGGAAYAIGQID